MAEPIDLTMERRKRDKTGSLEQELEDALQLMVRVANYRQTVEEMGKWISLNYPHLRRDLPPRMRELPPKNDK